MIFKITLLFFNAFLIFVVWATWTEVMQMKKLLSEINNSRL